MTATWTADVFDRIYARDADPWRFDSSSYERDKYVATLGLLPDGRIGTALEIGCSIGVFTLALAERCDALLAIDCAEAALARAAAFCATAANVRFERHFVPGSFPAGNFDLIVISEVLYFLSGADIGHLADRAVASLRPGGHVILANWTGPTDTPCTGDEAAELFIASASAALSPNAAARGDSYRLDRLVDARGAPMPSDALCP